jgi:hypothetical protein
LLQPQTKPLKIAFFITPPNPDMGQPWLLDERERRQKLDNEIEKGPRMVTIPTPQLLFQNLILIQMKFRELIVSRVWTFYY